MSWTAASEQYYIPRTGVIGQMLHGASAHLVALSSHRFGPVSPWCVAAAVALATFLGGGILAAGILAYAISAALFVLASVQHRAAAGLADRTLGLRLAKMEQANDELREQVIALTADRDALKRQINIDPLTGAQNRRGLETAFDSHFEGMVLAMLDLDHFKRINDTLGHDVGDRVLQDFARLLRDRLGGDTPIYRIGGEEFIVLFPQGEVSAVAALLDDFRRELANTSFTRLGDTLSVSFSAGLAVSEGAAQPFEDIYKRADESLYAAKSTGRGKTVHENQPVFELAAAA